VSTGMNGRIRFNVISVVLQFLMGASMALEANTRSKAGVEDSSVPPFLIAWDINSADSSISKVFSVTEHRYYDFLIAFQGAITGTSTEERLKQLRDLNKFTGDGGTVWVTKESADTDSPVVVSAGTDPGQLQEGIRTGKYVARMQKSGVMIPVHLVVESLGTSGRDNVVVYDRIVKTWNIEAGSKDGVLRTIASVELRPGAFRVTATTAAATPVPANIRTALRVTYRPDTRVSDTNR